MIWVEKDLTGEGTTVLEGSRGVPILNLYPFSSRIELTIWFGPRSIQISQMLTLDGMPREVESE